MSDYIIEINGSFTSSVFYDKVLQELHNCLSQSVNNRVVFDLTSTTFIDALVIPNLLCVGYILHKTTKKKPQLRMINESDYMDADKRKKTTSYLYEIGFMDYATLFFEIFDFSKEPKKRVIPEYCTTFLFNTKGIPKKEIAYQIMSKSEELFSIHLKEYFEYDEYFGNCNVFAKFAAELCHNSMEHGNSFSFMTIQTDLSKGLVYIAVSDCGLGFLEALRKKSQKKEIEHELYTLDEKELFNKKNKLLPLHAIVEGAFYRFFDKPYGIYDITNTVLKSNGLIRIHSDKAMVIITQNEFPEIFRNCETAEELSVRLIDQFIKHEDFNYKADLKYGGTHYEIIIPIDKREVKS